MARKKEPPKFTGPLAKPIIVPLDLPALGSITFEFKPHGLAESISKLELLREYYGVDDSNWIVLVLKLAQEFVPGFQIVYDDPLASELGLPRAGGAKANRKSAQPWLWGPRLLAVVAFLKRIGAAKGLWQTDKECAEKLFDDLRQPGRITKAEKLAGTRTIVRKIAEARRREQGSAIVVRSGSKLH